RESVLLDVMPIGGRDSASAADQGSLAHPSWPIAALLVGRRIFRLKHPLGSEIRRYRIAIISQKQGLSAITDKHQSLIRNIQLVRMLLRIKRLKITRRRTQLSHTPNG